MKDQKTVSNEFHELEYVAKKFNLTFQDVVDAKKATGSNKRDVIYAYLEKLPAKVKVVITDEQIMERAKEYVKEFDWDSYEESEVARQAFIDSAEWMRDQLTGEAKS